MRICPITYQSIESGKYSQEGVKRLSPSLKFLNDLAFTKEEQLREAAMRANKLSIQGVQPKLSAKLSIKKGEFELIDKGGTFILKPQNLIFKELPENEDLTMRLASTIGLNIPLHGLIYSKDGSLTYFIKRFDRYGKNKKYAVEDFAQLAGKTRDTKYNYSMEKVVKLLDLYCTFPAIEKSKLFKLTLFNYLVGNEDMHLKNFSIITQDDVVKMSPHYDLINTTIVMDNNAIDEIALPLNGRKKKLTKKLFVDYFGGEILGLNSRIISQTLKTIYEAKRIWTKTISISFLSKDMKSKYLDLLEKRWNILYDIATH